MTPLKAGAIALTLIIAVPIILGYGLASEENEVDVDVTENTGSLSDIVLNSTTPYYVTYGGANNNYAFLRTTIAQGNTYSDLTNPDYNVTSATTYTYTPIYATSSATVSVPTTSENYTASYTYYGAGSGISYDVELPSFALAGLTNNFSAVPPTYQLEYSVDSDIDYVNIVTRTEIYAMASGSGYLLSGTDSDDEDFEIQCDGFRIRVNGDLDMVYRGFYTIPDSFPDVWSTNPSGHLVLNLTVGSTTTAVAYTNATGLSVSYSTVTVMYGTESDIYTDVTGIGYAKGLGSPNFIYTYQSSTVETYADVSYGWTIPTSTYAHYDYWQNGFVNSYVRMMVTLAAEETFTVSSSQLGTPSLYLTSDSNGYVTAKINGTEYGLGTYTNMMIEVDAGTGYITVTGISSWPSIGALPATTYNSVTGSSGITEDFSQLFITDINTGSVDIRVDSAEIVAGYFPSTKDRVIDIYSLFPEDRRQSIIIDSVGVYGDYLTIGGVARTVTDGQITVWDDVSQSYATVNVLGMTIDYVESEDGTTWTTYVNGNLTSRAQSEPRLIFGGEWSLTLHRAVTTTETVMKTSWVPGEFALDENGFVMAMLLVAVATFVGLGMTGGRSGAKVGVLALICGGAVMVGLTLI